MLNHTRLHLLVFIFYITMASAANNHVLLVTPIDAKRKGFCAVNLLLLQFLFVDFQPFFLPHFDVTS